MADRVSPYQGLDALPPVAMQSHRRPFDRTLVAKLSDARERLYALVERARAENAPPAADTNWPQDLNAPHPEVSRG